MIITFIVILILAFLGGAVYTTIKAIVLLRQILLFRREGKTVTGNISNFRLDTAYARYSSEVKHYSASFTYSLDEKTYEKTVPISAKHYKQWQKDMPITVIYLASRPEIARLADDSTVNEFLGTYIFLTIVLLSTAIGIFLIVINAHTSRS